MAFRKTRARTGRSTTRRTASRKISTRRASNGGNLWSREEIAFMRKFYRNHETAWVARQLGRTVYSVRYKASDLSIKKTNPSKWVATSSTRKPARRTAAKKRYASPSRRRSSARRAAPRRTTRRVARRRTR